jgi:hypothetical protein
MTGKRWTKETIIDLGKVGCATLLLFAPWAFDFASDVVAAWNAWISGSAILVAVAMVLIDEAQWEGETTLALGIWLSIAPSVLGFPSHASAAMTHVLVGFSVSTLAVAKLWLSHRRPPQVRA